jgi:hypothetical protein
MATNLENTVSSLEQCPSQHPANFRTVSNLGPQNIYPIPEGILNYNGTNTVAITLWSLDPQGARLGGFLLNPEFPIMSGYRRPALAPTPAWQPRPGSY